MAVVEEYELEIDFEHDEAAGGRATPEKGVGFDVRARAKALAGAAAVRMRAAPLVLLLVASVVGFAAFSELIAWVVALFIAPEVFVPGSAAGGVDSLWAVLMMMLLATMAGLTGALLVFWRRRIGWACLAAFAIWQLVGPFVVYQVLISQFDFPAGLVPSFWEGLDASDWTMMATRFLFLSLLFLPPVLRWVIAKPLASARASAPGAGVTSEAVTSARSRPWSVQGARAPVLR